ncbi:MAG: AEC family transporter [Sphingobium sp.]
MLTVLSAVLPIFTIILTGWIARRTNVLGPHATREINRYVVYLAFPALLFDIVANVRWQDVWQPGFIAAFAIGVFTLFAATVLLRWRVTGDLADATIDGLNAAYANTAFLGFPLVAVLIGPAALPLPMIATLLTVCLLFAVGIVLIESARGAGNGRGSIAITVVRSLATNPLVLAPVLGALAALSGLAIPPPVETFLKLLGSTAAPCALIALGLFLAQESEGEPARSTLLAGLVGAKLIVQPLLTWIVAAPLLALPPDLVRAAVLIAALPTGTGPFMLANFYGREAGATSRVILISTILSIVTVSVYLAWSAG